MEEILFAFGEKSLIEKVAVTCSSFEKFSNNISL